MATTELTTTNSTALDFGKRDELKELAFRLRTMMPNATKFTEAEALAVAQVARLNDLDPFNGEVWGIKGKDGTWKGVMVGVKGLRKASNRQARSEGSNCWTEFRQADAAKYGATKPGAIVFECLLRDTQNVQAWGKSLNILTTAGVPYPEAVKMIGPCPVVIGIGIADPGEYSQMGLVQRAKKRAESDALKQRYQVSFGRGVIMEGDQVDDETAQAAEEGEVVTGDAVDVGPQWDQPGEPEPELSEYQKACELTTPSGKKLREFNDSQLESMRGLKNTPEELKRAAGIIIEWRIENAKTEAQIINQLGFDN